MKKEKQISVMVERLRQLRAMDSGEGIRDCVVRWIEDPLKPKTKDGRLRVNPILALLLILALLATGTCVLFSLVQL